MKQSQTCKIFIQSKYLGRWDEAFVELQPDFQKLIICRASKNIVCTLDEIQVHQNSITVKGKRVYKVLGSQNLKSFIETARLKHKKPIKQQTQSTQLKRSDQSSQNCNKELQCQEPFRWLFDLSHKFLGKNIFNRFKVSQMQFPHTNRSLMQHILSAFAGVQSFFENVGIQEQKVLEALVLASVDISRRMMIFKKPLTPQLGETYQGKIGNLNVFAQQILPTYTSLLLISKQFLLYGTFSLQLRLLHNIASLQPKGVLFMEAKGSCFETQLINSFLYKEEKEWQLQGKIVSLSNNLQCESKVEQGRLEMSMFGAKNRLIIFQRQHKVNQIKSKGVKNLIPNDRTLKSQSEVRADVRDSKCFTSVHQNQLRDAGLRKPRIF